MRFIPEETNEIIAEEEFPEAIKEIEAKLEAVMHKGSFKAFDNTEIYYEYFLREKSRASVVIVHGLSEFTKKYRELAYYLLNEGYDVFIFDQRCHGLSGRLAERIELLHVDSFYDYVKDLDQFIEEVVKPNTDKPLYIYSHSMGGAVSALYLEKYSDKIQKAVFAAPMFEPTVKQVPQFVGRWTVRLGKIFIGSKKKFMLTSEFNPETPWQKDNDASQNRFEHNMKMRRENVYYQSTPMTFGWVFGSLTVKSRIMKKRRLRKIKTPILLLSSELDKTVENKPQRIFSDKVDSCQFEEIKSIGHSVLTTDAQKMGEIRKLIFDFYSA